MTISPFEAFEEYPLHLDIQAFSHSTDEPNHKPREVYCESCKYRTITNLAGPMCGNCKQHLITIVRTRHDELVRRNSPSA